MSNEVTYLPSMKWFDLQKEVIERPNKGPVIGAGAQSQTNSDSKWSGASWEAAMGMMRDGWIEGARTVETLLDKVDMSEAMEPAWNIEAAGFFPCVPAYLAGDPECMWQRVDGEIIKPRICVIVPAVYNCNIDADEVLVYGTAMTALVRSLEAIGADAAVYSLDVTSAYGQGCVSQGFIVRDFGQPVDTSTIAYAFHPAFLRRTLFAHRELTKEWADKGLASGGYGQHTALTKENVQPALGDLSAAIAIMPDMHEMQRAGLLKESNVLQLIAKMREIVEAAKREAIGQ